MFVMITEIYISVKMLNYFYLITYNLCVCILDLYFFLKTLVFPLTLVTWLEKQVVNCSADSDFHTLNVTESSLVHSVFVYTQKSWVIYLEHHLLDVKGAPQNENHKNFEMLTWCQKVGHYFNANKWQRLWNKQIKMYNIFGEWVKVLCKTKVLV